MRIRDLLPALALAVLAPLLVGVGWLLPFGTGPVLVRVEPAKLGGVLARPAMNGVAIVDLPASGYAVLHGDMAAIRSAFGFAVAWRGDAPCSPAL